MLENYLDPELGSKGGGLEKSVAEDLDPVTLTWKDVNVYAMPKKGCCNRGQKLESPKQILSNGMKV